MKRISQILPAAEPTFCVTRVKHDFKELFATREKGTPRFVSLQKGLARQSTCTPERRGVCEVRFMESCFSSPKLVKVCGRLFFSLDHEISGSSQDLCY